MTTKSRWSPTTRSGCSPTPSQRHGRPAQSTLQAVDAWADQAQHPVPSATDRVVAFNEAEVITANPAAERCWTWEVPWEDGYLPGSFWGIAPLETILTLEQDCLEAKTVRESTTLLFLLSAL